MIRPLIKRALGIAALSLTFTALSNRHQLPTLKDVLAKRGYGGSVAFALTNGRPTFVTYQKGYVDLFKVPGRPECLIRLDEEEAATMLPKNSPIKLEDFISFTLEHEALHCPQPDRKEDDSPHQIMEREAKADFEAAVGIAVKTGDKKFPEKIIELRALTAPPVPMLNAIGDVHDTALWVDARLNGNLTPDAEKIYKANLEAGNAFLAMELRGEEKENVMQKLSPLAKRRLELFHRAQKTYGVSK